MLNILITYNGVEHVEEVTDVANGLSEFIKDKYSDLKVRVAPLLHCGSLFENVTKDEYIIYVSFNNPVVLTDACLNNDIYKKLALDGRIFELTLDTPDSIDYSSADLRLISNVMRSVIHKYVYNRDFRVQNNLLAKKIPCTFTTEPIISLDNSSLGNVYLNPDHVIVSLSKNLYLALTNDESSFTYVDVLYILDVNTQNILSFGDSFLKKALLKPDEEFTFALFDLNKIESIFGTQDVYKLAVCYRINDKEYIKEFIID